MFASKGKVNAEIPHVGINWAWGNGNQVEIIKKIYLIVFYTFDFCIQEININICFVITKNVSYLVH